MSAEREKRWGEVLLTPLAIALVGAFSTFFITRYQIKSAEKVADAQMQSSRELSDHEQQLKLLEIFAEKFTSGDPEERESSLKLLRMANPEFADKVASAIAGDSTEQPEIRREAREISSQVTGHNYFPVVASFRSLKDASDYARDLRRRRLDYAPEVYLKTGYGIYVVTLGGNLSYSDAKQRVDYARKTFAGDAYVRLGREWGENLLP